MTSPWLTALEATARIAELEHALLDARRFIWLHLLCVDGAALAVRRIDDALHSREHPIDGPGSKVTP